MDNFNDFHIKFKIDKRAKDLDNILHRYRLLYVKQEQLRLEHNIWGQRFRNGKVTRNEWKEYLKNIFNLNSFTISKEIGNIKNKLLSEFSFKLQSFDTTKTEYPFQVNTDERKMHYLLVLIHRLVNTDRDNPLLNDVDAKLLNLREKFKHGL